MTILRFKKTYAAAVASLLVLAGCSDDFSTDTAPPDAGSLSGHYFVLGGGNATRATVENDHLTIFNGGEIVGAFAIDASGNPIPGEPQNVAYTVKEIDNHIEGKTCRVLAPADESRALKKIKGRKYLFYSPYKQGMTADEIKNRDHTVKTMQDHYAPADGDYPYGAGYFTSDFMWANATGEENYCHVEFLHAMANIVVVTDGKDYDNRYGMTVLNQPLTAKGMNLTVLSEQDMTYEVTDYYGDIKAYFAPYSTNNERYRACVPANRTVKSGTQLFKMRNNKGEEKTFSLKKDLMLEPGKNYIFTLVEKKAPQPEISDDDSWVLDVIDPETGRPVGLLCREYLRFQPSDENDIPTTPSHELHGGKPTVNSQAWVFYNYQDGKEIPELGEGQVMRMLFDLRINIPNHTDDKPSNETESSNDIFGGFAWPAPHVFYGEWANKGFGLYLADHSYTWHKNPATNHGESYEKRGEFYMHGARVVWDGVNNKIKDFVMPGEENSATDENAEKYAHIAIPTKGKPFVSFKPINTDGITDADGAKVGVTLPHCLIDSRLDENKKVTRHAYPLVKIGFNLFWMSKSFRGKTLIDGTPLRCYNIINEPGKSDVHSDIKGDWDRPVPQPGILYPILNNGGVWIDPYTSGQGNLEELDHKYELPLLYNHKAFYDDKILPKAIETGAVYDRPSDPEYHLMHDYLAYMSVVKMMSNSIQTRYFDTPMEDNTESFLKGKYMYHGQGGSPNVYPGNVSGFNIKAFGWRTFGSEPGWLSMGSGGGFWIYRKNLEQGPSIPLYHAYDAWGIDKDDDKAFAWNNKDYTPGGTNSWITDGYSLTQREYYRDVTFTQVRFVMRYLNPTAGNRNMPTRSSYGPESETGTRNVYVDIH